MLRKLTASIMAALLAFAPIFSTPAYAATGHRFMPRATNPVEVAALVEESLKLDPSGDGKLIELYCKHKPSAEGCSTPSLFPATPKLYLEMIMAEPMVNPGAPAPTVGGVPVTQLTQVAQFLRELKKIDRKDIPKGNVWTACVEDGPNGKPVAKAKCESRPIGDDEDAWGYVSVVKDASTNTTEDETVTTNRTRTITTIFLAGNCKNPIFGLDVAETKEVIVTGNCVKAKYKVPPGTVRILWEIGGPNQLPDAQKCAPAYKQPGDTDWKTSFLPCPNQACFKDPESAAAEINYQVNYRQLAMYDNITPGEHEFRLPAYIKDGNIFMVCVEVRGPDGKVHPWQVTYLGFRANKHYQNLEYKLVDVQPK